MTDMDKSWAQELRRRIGLYDEYEASGRWPGKMTAVDYLGLAALAVVLVVGFSFWGL